MLSDNYTRDSGGPVPDRGILGSLNHWHRTSQFRCTSGWNRVLGVWVAELMSPLTMGEDKSPTSAIILVQSQ